MTFEQIVAGIAIWVLFVVRPFAYRLISKKYSTKTASLCAGTWLLIGTVCTMPFFYNMLFDSNGNFYLSQEPLFILSIIKGISLWLLIRHQQFLNRESISASVFFSPIGMGFGVIANRFLFNEQLTQMQFFAVLGLAILGAFFFFIGSVKNLNRKNKIRFLMLTLSIILFMGSDHIVISKTNWYAHITVVNLSFFLTSFFSHSGLKDWQNALFHRNSAIAGSVYTLGEFILIGSMVTIIPVSIANLFIRLAIPFVMVISSLLYKEGKWQEQLLFGCCALGLCLPLIFR